jgi:hypothetical protein
MNDRAAAWFEASLHHHLWFSERDEHDGASLPFGLCRRGDLTVVRNVSCGAIDGREVRLFDLDVMVRRDATSGMEPRPQRMIAKLIVDSFAEDDTATHAVTERWECALVRAGAECGRVSVAPEGLMTMLADIVTFRDQDLELEAFNRAFEVRADDRRFANALLDARMIELLVDRAVGCVVETVGNRILVASPAGDVPDADVLIGLAFAIAEHVPRVVTSLHPAAPTVELTPGCPVGPDGVVRETEEREAGSARFDPWPDVPSGWA